MPYIAPDSTIKLFKNIPFDPGYNDTMYFANETAQFGWFNDRVFKTYNNVSYQRHTKNTIRLEERMDIAFNYNYMAFQNTSFEGKWFYAFVTDVEYINNLTVEIRYEIDYIQTWIHDCDFNECFILREHPTTDNYSDNLLPEPVSTGPLIYNEIRSVMYHTSVVLITTIDSENLVITIPANLIKGYGPLDINGMVSGCWFYKFPMTVQGMGSLVLILKAAETLKRQNDIIGLIMVADELWEDEETEHIETFSMPTTLGNYAPRNKKLLCYPFHSLSVSRGDGNETIFQQELFKGVYGGLSGDATFKMWQNKSPICSIAAIPLNYKGKTVNYDAIVENLQSPQCSWISDQFSAWLAQNLMGVTLPWAKEEPQKPYFSSDAPRLSNDSLVPSNSQGMSAGTASNISPMAEGAMIAIDALELVSDALQKSITTPKDFHGMINNYLRYQIHGFKFDFAQKCITTEYARRIDKFFDMFGYSVNRVGVPSFHNRPKYTYIKTGNCSVHGMLPANAARKIEYIINKGIRFWDTSATFGNFDPDVNNNRPV